MLILDIRLKDDEQLCVCGSCRSVIRYREDEAFARRVYVEVRTGERIVTDELNCKYCGVKITNHYEIK